MGDGTVGNKWLTWSKKKGSTTIGASNTRPENDAENILVHMKPHNVLVSYWLQDKSFRLCE